MLPPGEHSLSFLNRNILLDVSTMCGITVTGWVSPQTRSHIIISCVPTHSVRGGNPFKTSRQNSVNQEKKTGLEVVSRRGSINSSGQGGGVFSGSFRPKDSVWPQESGVGSPGPGQLLTDAQTSLSFWLKLSSLNHQMGTSTLPHQDMHTCVWAGVYTAQHSSNVPLPRLMSGISAPWCVPSSASETCSENPQSVPQKSL